MASHDVICVKSYASDVSCVLYHRYLLSSIWIMYLKLDSGYCSSLVGFHMSFSYAAVPHETEISCGGRQRTSPAMKALQSSQKLIAERPAVSFIDWLGVSGCMSEADQSRNHAENVVGSKVRRAQPSSQPPLKVQSWVSKGRGHVGRSRGMSRQRSQSGPAA
jgi:hypothetical protein